MNNTAAVEQIPLCGVVQWTSWIVMYNKVTTGNDVISARFNNAVDKTPPNITLLALFTKIVLNHFSLSVAHYFVQWRCIRVSGFGM